MLNPSSNMTLEAAQSLADEQHLEGFARVSLVNWARAAAINRRFSAEDANVLFEAAGLAQVESQEKVGSGLALFVKGRKG
jgi:hypothetical protein